MKRLRGLLVVPLLTASLAAVTRADGIPAPDFARVDHTQPNAHLALSPRMGDAARIRTIAKQLTQAEAKDTLVAIYRWIDRNLRANDDAGRTWRTFDQMLEDRCYGSCADHAAMFGTLARAAGIPTIWVKTMDVDWIRRFRGGDAEAMGRYVGHVFLEVWLGGRWRLLDAQGMRLWESYAPKSRILPGQRFAYDKGDDPYELVLSCRWEDWKAQTDRYFRSLDLTQIPWSRSEDLLAGWRLHLVPASGSVRSLRSLAARLGYQRGLLFDQRYDTWLPKARGGVLMVLSKDGRPVLPERYWDAWLPAGVRDVVAGRRALEAGWMAHRLPDGTRVIWIHEEGAGKIEGAVAQALSAGGR